MVIFLALLTACTGDDPAPTDTPEDDWACVVPSGEEPDSTLQIGCRADFDALAADPLDASIPGAQSVKTVLDLAGGEPGVGELYFTQSERYPVHFDFAKAHLSGNGRPIVADLNAFNRTEYYAPDRRFILGAVTWYEEPGVFVYEIAPYDTADATMITAAYRRIAENAYFGDQLLFHPTSEAVEEVAASLPADVKQISTAELYAGITYQPLNLGTSMGQLRFRRAADAENYVNYREIVVLDAIPNELSVVAGTITDAFQTPLAHINVLAQNRGTPNMALIGAFDDPTLRALDGKWVELTVEALSWEIREVSEAEADAWWEAHAPQPLAITPIDTSVTGLWDCADILDPEKPLADALRERVPAFGGKATNMGAVVNIGPEVPVPGCFVTPMYYYDQHMRNNGLWDRYDQLTRDPTWGDPVARAGLLEAFQEEVRTAPIDLELLSMVREKIDADFARAPMRFRSSTNAEDLGNFTGAGLYVSKTGDWDDFGADIADAMREVWASTWGPRAWEEREYWRIDHTKVGMALMSNPSFRGEDANGVAITANIYDTAGLEPAFYVNVQRGEDSVVIPPPGTTTDQLLYYYTLPGQPVVYIAHSNQVPAGESVMTSAQLYELGTALDAIHATFYEAYGVGGGFYAMDTEFKVVDGHIVMKQARPYPGWSSAQ